MKDKISTYHSRSNNYTYYEKFEGAYCESECVDQCELEHVDKLSIGAKWKGLIWMWTWSAPQIQPYWHGTPT